MSKPRWKAPIFLDLDSLETPEQDEWSAITHTTYDVVKPKDKAPTYQKPVMLDMAETVTEPVLTPHAVKPLPSHAESIEAEYIGTETIAVPAARPSTIPEWIWPAVGGAIALALLLEMVFFLLGAFSEHVLLGVSYLLLLSAIVTAIGFAVRHYYLDMRALSNITAMRAHGDGIFKDNAFGQCGLYMGEMMGLYQDRRDMMPHLEKYVRKKNDAHSDRDAMLLFSDTVMRPLDKKAYEITVQRSKEAALMVVLSPFAFLDVLLTLWRNVRLIRDIAALYGGRPGFLSSMGLIKKVLQSLAYAEVGELIADSAAEMLGGSVISALSTHLAHGIGSGVMTARVGIHAMQVCRPLPYIQNDKPNLKGVRKEILKSVKIVFDKEPQEKFSERHV